MQFVIEMDGKNIVKDPKCFKSLKVYYSFQKGKIRKCIRFFINNLNLLDVELLQEAEECIVKMVQFKYLNEGLKQLKMETKKMLKSVANSAV